MIILKNIKKKLSHVQSKGYFNQLNGGVIYCFSKIV